MSYKLNFTKTFLKELALLPQNTRLKAEKIVFEECLNNEPDKLFYIKN